jgi:hypothetical protein
MQLLGTCNFFHCEHNCNENEREKLILVMAGRDLREKLILVMAGRDLRGSKFGANGIHNDQIDNFFY